jgi:DNA-binding NarL/FixJ family response regulator
VQFFARGARKVEATRRLAHAPPMIRAMNSNAERNADLNAEPSAELNVQPKAAPRAERLALVVEDHPLYSEALVNTTERAGLGLRCRAVGGVQQARRAIEELGPPTLLLCDHRLPDGDGLQLLAEMAGRVPLRVLLSGQDDPALVHRARAARLSAFMPKTLPPDDMVLALRRVLAGEPWFPRGVVAAPPTLTERQLEVLREVGRGLSNREIAARLGVSERTVKDHLSIVFVRLGAANRAEALVQAGAQGLLQFSSLQ